MPATPGFPASPRRPAGRRSVLPNRCAAVALLLATVNLTSSCATTHAVTDNVHRVISGQPVDSTGLHQAVTADSRVIQADVQRDLEQLRRRFAAAVAQLRANVQKRWGQGNARVADRTVYVKYTQGYKSRVITDFDHGVLTVETLDDKDPRGSLESAIVAALLTTSDPASVDLFTDKEVVLDAAHRPYLYGLVHDNHGRSIGTARQAQDYAQYLVANRARSRPVDSGKIAGSELYVRLTMVSNYEEKGADRYRTSVEKYAAQYHVSPSLVFAIMRTESNFNPFAVSGAPAYGLMQLVPTSGGRAAVRRAQGVDETPSADTLLDPEHNIELGVAYLSVLDNEEFHAVANQTSRDYCVIAAYNTGPHNVTRIFASDKDQAYDAINALQPPALFERLRTDLPYAETREYVVKVSGYRKQFVTTPATAAAM